MSYQVEITQTGRGGWSYYIEDGKTLSFDWDFSIGSVEIYVPTPEEWDAFCEKRDAGWAKGRRLEILVRLAEEIRKQKAKSAKVSIEDHWIILSFTNAWIPSFLRSFFH